MTAEPGVAAPPAAARIPAERTHHGDTVTDEYSWLAGKENPETIAFLDAENAYTQAMTAGQAPLRDAIFGEIRARTQETDLSVPARKGGWWYYTRTVEGQQYALHCRRPVRPDDTGPPGTGDGGARDGDVRDGGSLDRGSLDGEEILLDGNELAGDGEFFSLGAFSVSPDGRLLAYSTDFAGSERFTLRVKDLVSGETAADEIPGTFYGGAWSADGSALFYVTVDEAWRPYRVWRHVVGTPAADDVIVFEEPDERFWVGVVLTRSERFLVISASSKLTSEVWLLDAAHPAGEFRVVAPRRHGVEYEVEHQVTADGTDRLLILHNDHAENFELAQAPLADPAAWTPVVRHRAGTRLLGVERVRRPPRHPPAQGRADRAAGAAGRRQPARDRLPRAGLPGLAGGEPRVPRAGLPAGLRLAGDAGLRVRLRHRDGRADPAAAPPGAAPAGRGRVRPGRL